MSESKGTLRASGHDLPPTSDGGDGGGATSIGDYLKRQRLLRGVTIEDLAANTRIPLRSLERLEAGYFDGVTDGFVRGFVRTVAIALGLDADQTVARMLDEPVSRKWDREGIGLWRKQVLALVALVAATAIGALSLRAGWNLFVGGSDSAKGREVVAWRDPVHQLARDVAEGRFVIPPVPEPLPEPEIRAEPSPEFHLQPGLPPEVELPPEPEFSEEPELPPEPEFSPESVEPLQAEVDALPPASNAASGDADAAAEQDGSGPGVEPVALDPGSPLEAELGQGGSVGGPS